MNPFTVTVEIGDPQGSRFELMRLLAGTRASFIGLPASVLRRLGVVPMASAGSC
jgi:hypothetical protein